MSNFLEEIAMYLHSLGVGIYNRDGANGNIFLETLPEGKGRCIGIYCRGGEEGDLNGEVIQANIQFIIRNPKKLEALDQGSLIIKNICGFNSGSFIENGHYIIDTWALQGVPVYIGVDKSGRHEYSINLSIEFNA